jgi:protein tyrosine phosphatase (PTP) superfamily phosphohydrolase (DUF442 family)
LDLPGVPNAIQIHQRVISGGLPQGEAAFAALARAGIKTIISVDGARPDVESARKHGLRYVHLPHGYDGISEQRLKDLAKAIQELPGPIYIHCHHGKHRSPAAAAAGCVAAGLVSQSSALSVLEMAGTSPNYRGLFQAVKQAKPLDKAQIADHRVAFQEVAPIPPLAAAMVEIDEIFERLKLLAAAGWGRLPGHPDLDAAHEVLLLREQYRELARQESVAGRPAAFRAMLAEAEATAGEWESALRQWQRSSRQQPVPESVGRLYLRAAEQCRRCHERFRDVPLSEKPPRTEPPGNSSVKH